MIGISHLQAAFLTLWNARNRIAQETPQNRLRMGLRPDLAGGAYDAPQTP